MNDFTINEMRKLQDTLQNKYKDKWEPISPETGKNKILWMIGETGEVIDIIKKHGHEAVMSNPVIKQKLIEELTDVLMYYNDVLNCYDISTEDLKQTYINKFNKNMSRW